MKRIDAYAHVGLPRFLSAEEMIAVLDENEIDRAVISGAETCPDVIELSRAAAQYPSRFRAIGMPMGRDSTHVRENVTAQLEAGFIGIRLPAAMVAQQPDLMDIMGRYCAIPFIFGPDVFGKTAGILCDYLENYPQCVVVAPHFAGIPHINIFDELPDARRLLDHPRFLVVFSRQGAYERTLIGSVARFLVEQMGWERLMWGSEYPVCLWRNETFASTVNWIDYLGLKPTEAQRSAFFYGNARKHIWISRERPPRELDDRFDLMPLRKPAPVWLFPRDSMDIDEEVHRTLFLAYLARGGEKSRTYQAFIADLLVDAAHRLEG